MKKKKKNEFFGISTILSGKKLKMSFRAYTICNILFISSEKIIEILNSFPKDKVTTFNLYT